ncbi:FAD-dependent oxidoreductase [Caldovatus sediminis]|uniref:FAD-dependent oxidoreductase n=1 Tax=Caldovatus sediminis TaxID=2041189 RepID=A0A8J2ZAR5_9PROT|nr:NAD(P)/FAD-dependent oxidoreductase [Caldovatus sediminis]GGG28633.1 FAD-dependent oxidoreductase [Caldovatus sediminis]
MRSRSSATYDALVIGARCAGAATAMLMARRGMRVLAVDRGAYGSDTLSTHALMRGGVLQLHRWGLLPRLAALGTPAVRNTIFHYGEEVVDIDIRPSDGVDALYAPRRTVLDALLVDAAWSAGAEVRHGHSLIELVRRPDGRIAGAVLADPEGRRVEIAADLVVGADGIASTVARQVEAPVTREARHTTAVIYGYWSGLGWRTAYNWLFRPGSSAGAIATNDGAHCVFAAIPPARFRDSLRQDMAAGFREVVAEVSPALAEAVAGARLEGRLWAFAGRRGFLRRPYGSGWALVGDAAYFKDPLTAHGITDAFRDAELLAAAAAEGTEEAFAAYERTRNALSMPLFEATEAIASFEWDIEAVKRHHLALNKAMRPEVEHLVALGPAPRAAASPLTGEIAA